MGSGAPVVVTAGALFENLHDGDESDDPFLLDIRSPEDYAAGHIEGAVNIPFKQGFTAENWPSCSPTSKSR
jgi:rhodanese-related sulfurtransferase